MTKRATTSPAARSTSANDAPRLAGQIDGTTRLMAMLGDPIKQAKTPQVINPIFEALCENIVCIPVHVGADDLVPLWSGLKAMRNLVGFSVTIPHKSAVLELCDSLDPSAIRTGAVNVVRREPDGQFRGYQFDGIGFIKGLEKQGHRVRGRDCLIVGAGGAAAAIAFALIDAGANSLRISNRTLSRAEHLAAAVNAEFGRETAFAGPPEPAPDNLVINATSLGLHADDALPIDPSLLDETMIVAEVIAKPETTRLLVEAKRRGAAVHSGIHMVENQVELIARHLAGLPT